MARVALWADKQWPLRRSISTRLYICTLSDVQFCARAHASACGKSRQPDQYILINYLRFSAFANMYLGREIYHLRSESGDFSKLVLRGTRKPI